MKRYAAPSLGLPQVSLGFIPKGYLGTQTTLKHIQALIRAGAKDLALPDFPWKRLDVAFRQP
jgi:hypothetical protein